MAWQRRLERRPARQEKAQRRGACIFCGSKTNPLTREHVWGDWISRLFHPVRKRRQYTLHRRTRDQSTSSFVAASINLTARLVCQPCNNDWMSELENDYVKPILSDPILRGDAIRFTVDDQVTLAAWAFKTAVLIDHMTSTRRRPFFSAAVRRRFATTLMLPEGVQIWIMGHNATRLKRRTAYYVSHYLKPASARLKHFEFYVVTFVVGHFAFQVFAPRKPNRVHRRLPVLRPDSIWKDLTLRVWPSSGRTISWPPSGHYLSDDVMEQFAHRWARSTM